MMSRLFSPRIAAVYWRLRITKRRAMLFGRPPLLWGDALHEPSPGDPAEHTAPSSGAGLPCDAVLVEVRLLGGFAVSVEGVLVDSARWGGRRGQTLVKLLALSSGHRLHREQVMDALWPMVSVDVGAARLHRATHMARNALGDRGAIAVSAGGLALWPSAEVVVDVERFEALAREVRDSSST